jgi:hypothetical protein
MARTREQERYRPTWLRSIGLLTLLSSVDRPHRRRTVTPPFPIPRDWAASQVVCSRVMAGPPQANASETIRLLAQSGRRPPALLMSFSVLPITSTQTRSPRRRSSNRRRQPCIRLRSLQVQEQRGALLRFGKTVASCAEARSPERRRPSRDRDPLISEPEPSEPSEPPIPALPLNAQACENQPERLWER